MAKKNAKGGGGKQSADNRPRKRPPQAKGGSGIDLRLLGVLAVAVCGAAAWFFAGGEDDAEGGGAARRNLRDERGIDDGLEFECGPEGTEHLSDQPAHGLHVLSGSGCGEPGAASFLASVYVDGSAAEGDAPTVEVACSPPASIDDWLLTAVRREVAVGRPALHNRLQDSGVLTQYALHELSARSGLSHWKFYTPYGTQQTAVSLERFALSILRQDLLTRTAALELQARPSRGSRTQSSRRLRSAGRCTSSRAATSSGPGSVSAITSRWRRAMIPSARLLSRRCRSR